LELKLENRCRQRYAGNSGFGFLTGLNIGSDNHLPLLQIHKNKTFPM